ncbi:MAG: response regulator transcription factor [Blastocatellia bacterium]
MKAAKSREIESVVFIVDDDPSVRAAVKRLVGSTGLAVETFATAQEFLEAERPDAPCCLILDVCLPGLSGLDLQRKLAEANILIPIIFLTSHGDIPMTVQAMKAGAVEFLTKPFRNLDLIEAVRQAVEQDREARWERAEQSKLRTRYETLTPRERDVMELVIAGLMNKQIAGKMGTSEVTVKAHRGQMMQKMEAESVADLVWMAERLGVRPPRH